MTHIVEQETDSLHSALPPKIDKFVDEYFTPAKVSELTREVFFSM